MDPYNDKDKVKQTDKLFFDKNDLSKQKVENLVNNTLNTYDGELFLENTESETFYFSDSRMQNISCNTSQGFGFRIIRDEVVGFSNFDKISFENLKKSSDTIRSIIKNENKSKTINHSYKYNKSLYIDENPITNLDFSQKLKLLNDINDYTRKLDNRVIQVSISLSGMLSLIQILKKDSEKHADIRPLVRLNIQVVVEENNLRSSGSSGCGGRTLYDQWVSRDSWEKQAKEALRLALINLHAKPAPAGEIPVVLGPGWPGVMLHEAVGHGLEGDFNRKGTSIYSNKIGTRVAAKGVDVFDNGTIKNRRGSITIDDEGTPHQKIY